VQTQSCLVSVSVLTSAQVIVPAMGDTPPATPRPAATIILLRRGGKHTERGVEVLMVRRAAEASFMPGVWVFPGGIIEAGEGAAECAARELAEEAGIELGEGAELAPWSRWITPEVVPVRFDTHFFVALAPPHSPPKADGVEVSDAGWFAPQAALDAHRAGELELVFPTIKTLETLLAHANADEVMAAASERAVEPILPRVVGTRADHRVVLPGEDGYEDGASDVDRLAP
jgi:8-oxo-dGTP pyrophosphatase MutT (NUDIX family)